MATTFTAAYSAGNDVFVAHVGHSRAYCFREGELRALTADHTMQGGTPTEPSRKRSAFEPGSPARPHGHPGRQSPPPGNSD